MHGAAYSHLCRLSEKLISVINVEKLSAIVSLNSQDKNVAAQLFHSIQFVWMCCVLAIPTATRSQSGGIRHDKRHACYYCCKVVTNSWRHYLTCHSTETEVQEIGIMRKDKKQCAISRLRMMGDYYHNLEVLSKKTGQLIVVRRPAAVGPTLKAVLMTMTQDSITLVARNDAIILSFGDLISHNCSAGQYTYVSQRMMQLARLPQHFDAVVQAVLTVSRFQNSTTAEPPKLMVPSLALKLGYALRECCTLLVNKALREKDSELEYDAASFARIYDSEWQSKVSSVALKTIAIDKRNKPDLLPLTADLVKIKQ